MKLSFGGTHFKQKQARLLHLCYFLKTVLQKAETLILVVLLVLQLKLVLLDSSTLWGEKLISQLQVLSCFLCEAVSWAVSGPSFFSLSFSFAFLAVDVQQGTLGTSNQRARWGHPYVCFLFGFVFELLSSFFDPRTMKVGIWLASSARLGPPWLHSTSTSSQTLHCVINHSVSWKYGLGLAFLIVCLAFPNLKVSKRIENGEHDSAPKRRDGVRPAPWVSSVPTLGADFCELRIFNELCVQTLIPSFQARTWEQVLTWSSPPKFQQQQQGFQGISGRRRRSTPRPQRNKN